MQVPIRVTVVKYFEDFQVGEKSIASEEYRVTEDEIIEFGTRFDPQTFHTDPVAAKSSIFEGLVASSAHLFAISVWFSRFMGEPAAAVSALGFDAVRIRTPARPGDRLLARSEVLVARRSQSRPDCGVVECRNEVINQDGEAVITYTNTFLVLLRNRAEG